MGSTIRLKTESQNCFLRISVCLTLIFSYKTLHKTCSRCLSLVFAGMLIGLSSLPFESHATEMPEIREILIQIRHLASSIDKSRVGRNEILRDVVTAQVKIKDIEGALETIALMKFNQDNALIEVVEAQAGSGDIKGAKKTQKAIKSEINGPHGLSDIAIAEAKAGDIQGAMKTLSRINKKSYYYLQTLKGIATVQAQTGDIKGALQTGLEVIDYEPQALWDILIPMIESGNLNGARDIVSKVENKIHRGNALWGIVQGQVNVEDVEGAIHTADSIETARQKAWAYVTIGKFQLRKGDLNGALHNLAVATKVAENVVDYVARAEILLGVVGAQVKSGNIEMALKTAALIEERAHRKWAAQTIMTAQAKSGDRNGALKTATLFGEKEDTFLYDFALIEISEQEALIGNVQGAITMIAKIKEEGMRSIAIVRVARAQAQNGDINGALKTAEKGNEEKALAEIAKVQADTGDIQGAVQTIENLLYKDKALIAIAKAQVMKGKTKEVLAQADMRKDPLDKAYMLLGIVQGMLERANLVSTK